MTKTDYMVAESVHLRAGDLLLLQKNPEPLPAYEDPSIEGFRERSRELWKGGRIIFVSDRDTVPIAGLDEVRAVIRRAGARLEEELQGQEKAFSVLVCQLLDLGAVIVPAQRYAALERRHGVSLDDNRPRIVGDTLRFLCRHVGLADLDAPLMDVSLDLTTMDYEARAMPAAIAHTASRL